MGSPLKDTAKHGEPRGQGPLLLKQATREESKGLKEV